MRRVAELDLLRFVAASMVVLYHYTYTETFGAFQVVSTYGFLGVHLFFLISGFVILWSAEGRTAGGFARSRFLRLYPMFWLGVAITLFALSIAGRANFSLFAIAANLTLLPGYLGAPMIDGVYWTLAVELKFYVLMFFAVLLRQIGRIEYWLYAWLAALFAAASLDIGAIESVTIFPYGFLFVGGALCCLIRSRGLTWLRAGALLVCAAASIHETIKGRGNFTWTPMVADPVCVGTIVGAFYASLLLISMQKVRLPETKAFVALGALTYPLYLLHNQIGKILFASLQLAPWLELSLIVVVVYTLAWVCATYLEPAARGAVGAPFPVVPRRGAT